MSGQPTELIAGRYRLDRVVGAGSSAQVWAARDTVLSREVAIKLLGERSDEEQSRIWREARLAALLGDSIAVPIYDFGDDGTHCFLVMELVAEPSLRTLLDSTPSPVPAMALQVAQHLLEALAITHEMSVVHRDIKPENMFVGGPPGKVERVRLVDFGLAFLEGGAAVSLGRLTDDRVLSGTPAYLSPEQAKGQDINAESDIYSAGCVLYEISCGVPPFDGTLGELLSKHMYVPAIPLSERGLDLPDAFMDLVGAMLAKKPADRPTAAEALETLRAITSGETVARGHGRDRTEQALRRDRMVPAGGRPGQGPDERPLLFAATAEELPGWLSEILAGAGVCRAAANQQAEFRLQPFDESLRVESPSELPCVVWIEDAARLSIARLIEAGVAFAISQDTAPRGLRRNLRATCRVAP